jgi:hypothetical protein
MELPDFTVDPWTRFDFWAERAHESAMAAVTSERDRGVSLNDMTLPLTDALNRAADVYRDLAQASRPNDAQIAAATEPAHVEHADSARDDRP